MFSQLRASGENVDSCELLIDIATLWSIKRYRYVFYEEETKFFFQYFFLSRKYAESRGGKQCLLDGATNNRLRVYPTVPNRGNVAISISH